MRIKNLKIKIQKTLSAFTLMEMLVTMAVLAILTAISAPVVSQLMIMKTGTDKNVLGCITKNNTSAWFSSTTGDIDTTALAADAKCYTAVSDTQNERGRALYTSVWYADNGNDTQKTTAKQLLRAACDQGGVKACDYFINKCWKSASATAPYCDDTTSFADLTYYLHQNTDTNTNLGASYIFQQLEGLLPKYSTNLVNEVTYACSNNQTPDNNQNLGANYACKAASPKLYIQACNKGHAGACETAYDNGYNTSCTAVKTNWPEATSGNYELAADGDPSAPSNIPVRTVNCNMTSIATAAITGCGVNGSTPVTEDCDAGFNNQYNMTCAQVFTYLQPPVEATYNLTSYGTPHAVQTTASCNSNAVCIAGGVGKLCDDGTIYLGQGPDGHYIFVTPSDQSTSAKWATNEITELTGINDPDKGWVNTSALVSRVSDWAPYKAAHLCQDLNNINYLGYADWYLPSKNEIYTIMTNNVAIGNLTVNSNYWSSSEYTALNAWFGYISTGTLIGKLSSGGGKNSTYFRVRCARKEAAQNMSCSTVGSICPDNSVYAGSHTYTDPGPVTVTVHLYVPKVDQGGSNYSWTNGNPAGTSTNATNPNNGAFNQAKLTTEPVISYPDAPYPAVNICKAMNDANGGLGTSFDGGLTYYKDWYLPARYELNLLLTNRAAQDIAGTYNTPYWSSTENSTTSVYVIGNSTAMTTYGKQSQNARVRCVRRFY